VNPAPTLDQIRAAAARIAPHVHRTPVMTSRTLARELSCTPLFKCENLQKVGAFKARGAVNAILQLDEQAAALGVVTHSSGNHAAALAYASSIRGVRCTVVMPSTAPAVKQTAVRGYGAEIVLCAPGEREPTCHALVVEHGFTLVHPFENLHVVQGAGTAALELLEDHGPLDFLFAPVGGGGLIAGTAVAVRNLAPRTRVIGVEPKAADDAARSLASGIRQPGVAAPKTIADGLLTGIGKINFEIARTHEVEIVTVDEEAIVDAAKWFLQRLKIVVEPSSATVLAAMRAVRERLAGKRVAAILSGGNTDFAWLPR
jgi:threonine dehydratase